MRNPARATVRIVVDLTRRQEQQLLAVSDALGVPFLEVGERAIVAFLAAHGHGTRGRLKADARRQRRRGGAIERS